jgi:acetylornithine aminotransferase
LVERAAQLERLFADGLARELAGVSAVREIRIKGMMIGIELDRPCTTLPAKALEQNLLINVTADSVIRLLPPLIMSDTEANQIGRSSPSASRTLISSPSRVAGMVSTPYYDISLSVCSG